MSGTGERFGPYELVRLIGRGGMGEVFEAHDVEQDRTVALKRLVSHLADDREFQARFRRESRVAARLRSPHVVPIHRSGEIDGHLFIDMRLVEGCDLEDLLAAEGPLDARRAVKIIEQVAWALDAAHDVDLVHRDVKPSNVLLDDIGGSREFVYLADFGITRPLGGNSVSLTSTHAVLGSLDYMAPEQFDGQASPSIDIYSLGCLLFQCLTGRKPFPAEGFPALMRAHLTKPAPLPSEVRAELGTTFDAVVARALAKEPEERYASAGALAAAATAALEAATARGAEPAASTPAPAPSSTPARPAALVGAGVAAGPAPAVGAGGAGVVEADLDGATSSSPTVATRIEAPGSDAGPAGPRAAGPPGSSAPAGPPRPAGPTGPPGRPGDPLGRRDGAAAAPGRRSRRGLVIGLAALGLVVVLALGVLVGTTVLGSGGSTSAPGTGQGALPVAPVAPTVASLDTPAVTGTFSVGNGPEAIALSPDGRRAFVTGESGANVLNVVDTASGAVTATVPAPGPPQFVVVDPAGAHAYVTLYDPTRDQNAVAVFDIARSAFTAVIPTTMERPFGLGISPDGGTLYVPNHDSGEITVIDTARQVVTAQIPVPMSPHWIAFNPTGRIAYAANHHAGVVTVLDTKTASVIGVIPIGDGVSPHSIAVTPDGRRAQVTEYDGNRVATIDTATNTVVSSVPVGTNPQSIAFARDGRHSYVVDNGSNTLSVLDTGRGAVTATIPLGTSPWMVAVSPDGRLAYATNKETNSITVLTIAR